jgi:predicted DNA-binding protein (MmcQ/YjbR family)
MKASGRPDVRTARAEEALRKVALSYPGAYEEFPWGERAVKVKAKVFLFMRASDQGLSLSTKLPESGVAALTFPFAEPTGYGLGKSGWVTASFSPDVEPPLELLEQWIDESYRAVAPKKLVAGLGGGDGASSADRTVSKAAAPAKARPKPEVAVRAKAATLPKAAVKKRTAPKRAASSKSRSR